MARAKHGMSIDPVPEDTREPLPSLLPSKDSEEAAPAVEEEVKVVEEVVAVKEVASVNLPKTVNLDRNPDNGLYRLDGKEVQLMCSKNVREPNVKWAALDALDGEFKQLPGHDVKVQYCKTRFKDHNNQDCVGFLIRTSEEHQLWRIR